MRKNFPGHNAAVQNRAHLPRQCCRRGPGIWGNLRSAGPVRNTILPFENMFAIGLDFPSNWLFMCLLDGINQSYVINNLIFQRELEDDRLLEQFHQHSWPRHLLGCHRLVIFSIPKQGSKCHKLHQSLPLHPDYEIIPRHCHFHLWGRGSPSSRLLPIGFPCHDEGTTDW